MGNNYSNSSFEDTSEIGSISDFFGFILIIIIGIVIYLLYNYFKK